MSDRDKVEQGLAGLGINVEWQEPSTREAFSDDPAPITLAKDILWQGIQGNVIFQAIEAEAAPAAPRTADDVLNDDYTYVEPKFAHAFREGWKAREAEAAAPAGSLDVDELRKQRGWPTPNAMRQCADGLDKIAYPRYGDILRWVADLCDDHLSRDKRDE